MIIDLYEYFKQHATINKIAGNGYLFCEYKCPIDVEDFQFYVETHLILFVFSGKKDWICSEGTYPIEAGDALFIRNGVYTTKQYFDVEHCVMLFMLENDFIQQFMRENPKLKKSANSGEAKQIYRIHVDEGFKTLMFSIFEYMRKEEGIPSKLLELKFNELLFNILLHEKNSDLAAFINSTTQSAKVRLEDVMNSHFHYDLDLPEFARLSGRSLSSFKREFKEHYQQSPGQWLNEKRLEYAKNLLLNSDLNVSQVCHESGFKNTSHFNKIFKKKYSLPPNQYRLQTQ